MYSLLMQVIKTRIQAYDPATRRLQLTLGLKKAVDAQKESQAAVDFKAGELLEASVASIESDADNQISAYKVNLLQDGNVVGTAQLDAPHLCDNPGALEALRESIQVACRITQVKAI